jgi:tRNA pseudouridine32 synthase/23S rRNA pseudouridine746 synthase
MISILFEDEDLVAANKPEGLAAIPERDRNQKSLLATLSVQLQRRLFVVHRIDKEVSGVILFAKNESAHRWLNEQFSNRAVRKTYGALAHGVIATDSGTIEKALRQFGSGRVGVDPSRGKLSSTAFRVTKRFASYTLVDAIPLSGRRHQIRVHFYSIGHPLVGDLRYGDRGLQGGFPRLMLHAKRIEFRLPAGTDVAIEAPTPYSFSVVMKAMRGGYMSGQGLAT